MMEKFKSLQPEKMAETIMGLPENSQNAIWWAMCNMDLLEAVCQDVEMSAEEIRKGKADANKNGVCQPFWDGLPRLFFGGYIRNSPLPGGFSRLRAGVPLRGAYWSRVVSKSCSITSSAVTPPSAVYQTAGWAR